MRFLVRFFAYTSSKSTRLRQHLIMTEKGVRFSNAKAAVWGRLQATEGRAGARWAQGRAAVARLQVQRPEHFDIGGPGHGPTTPSQRAIADTAITERIRNPAGKSDGTYGRPRKRRERRESCSRR